MSMSTRNPNEPIENLAIGQVIEVDGSHLVAELNPTLSELSRVYAGEIYPIGQFGSIVRIHFGRRLVYALVGRLRMKSEFQAERGLVPTSSSDERIVEADLFGEGEWIHKTSGEWELRFERGVSTYPLPQQTVYLTPKAELRFIYGKAKGAVVHLGQHVGSGGTQPFWAQLALESRVRLPQSFTVYLREATINHMRNGSPGLLYLTPMVNTVAHLTITLNFPLMTEH